MTRNYHPKNLRIKWSYFSYLKEADGKADRTIDGVRRHLNHFEKYTGFKDFATFNKEQAIGFKKHLATAKTVQTKQPLSGATMLTMLNNLRAFFKWLAGQNGYKSRINHSEIDYFKMLEKETRAAKAPKIKDFPTIEQIKKVIAAMPSTTDIEKRNRALIAFTIVTGIRDGALASLSLKHVSVEHDRVIQDPNEVKTKSSKHIVTYFVPIGGEIEQIVHDWVLFLKQDKLFSNNAPLFPRTKLGQGVSNNFEVQGLDPVHWQTASPIRQIFKEAFEAVGLPYFSPHTFRKTLTQFGEQNYKTPEAFKAFSQNLGHESTLTTFNSYGHVSAHRQGELIKAVGSTKEEDKLDMILQKLDRPK